jgi:acetyl-CoA/propionyl-CoA carboxylase, biotin carboxylase, biotin carboxyl carrier protein
MAAWTSDVFSTVLVANRGEIAVRIISTLRALGIRSVAVYSDADVDARHVAEADTAVRIGPAAALESYLNLDRVIAAAQATGAEAIHPGYGFLAENASFAERCVAAGLCFIGPPASAISAMGDKIRAKQMVEAAGVPVVPGSHGAGLSNDQLVEAALAVGLPVLLKPSAGGGGKGMRLVTHADELQVAITSSRREALHAFADDTLLVERFITRPRHIEIQVAADQHGNVVHLGERECSLQRRHQKIIEESPSPFVTADMRAIMGAQAVAAARACGYTNLGTIEFIVSGERPEDFFFMEMNTRLQVEHPVTEMAYGMDLVELQLRIADGEPLGLTQEAIQPVCYAVEARIYAEDPAAGFLPTGGTVLALHEPSGSNVRVDSGLRVGTVVGSNYDPMLAKIIASAPTRAMALRRLDEALGETEVLGVTTNVAFLRALLRDSDVQAGRLDTALVEQHLDALLSTLAPLPDAALAAVGVDLLANDDDGDPWSSTRGWRVGDTVPTTFDLNVAGRGATTVSIAPAAETGWNVSIDGGAPAVTDLRRDGAYWVATVGDAQYRFSHHRAGNDIWIGWQGSSWALHVADRWERDALSEHGGFDGSVRSPMPGTVLSVNVTVGQHLEAGQSVAVVEAMKMEHTVVAPAACTVEAVHVEPGAQVVLGEVLVTLNATGAI